MTSNRRNFLKQTLIGSGIIATGFAGNASVIQSIPETKTSGKQFAQSFNMCGYAAPKLDKVRIGFIGMGSRGPGAVDRMSHIEGCPGLHAHMHPAKLRIDQIPIQVQAFAITPNNFQAMCFAIANHCKR